MRSFAWQLSLGIVGWELWVKLALDRSLGNFRFQVFAWEFSLRNYRSGSFYQKSACEMSIVSFRLACFVWVCCSNRALGNVRNDPFGSVA